MIEPFPKYLHRGITPSLPTLQRLLADGPVGSEGTFIPPSQADSYDEPKGNMKAGLKANGPPRGEWPTNSGKEVDHGSI